MVLAWSLGTLLLAGLLAVVVSTVVGERRRGGSWPLAVAAGVAFPLTWAVWYVRDVRPYAGHPLPRTGSRRPARS